MPFATPNTLTPNVHRQSFGVFSHSCGSAGGPTPALLQRTWMLPNRFVAGIEQRIEGADIGDIGRDADDLSALLEERVRRRVERGGFDVGQHHAHALCDETLDDGAADAARRAGDHCCATRERFQPVPPFSRLLRVRV